MSFRFGLAVYASVGLSAHGLDFAEINARYPNLMTAQVKCHVETAMQMRVGWAKGAHNVIFGKNGVTVETDEDTSSGRLVTKLFRNLAPLLLNNLLPPNQTSDFTWAGRHLLHKYEYKGIKSVNEYIFDQELKLRAIEVRTSDGVKQVLFETDWDDLGGKYRLKKFVNNQYRHGFRMEISLTYGPVKIHDMPISDRMDVVMKQGDNEYVHIYRFSLCQAR